MILTQAPVFFSAFLCGLLPSALGLCSYACPPQVPVSPVNGEGTQAQKSSRSDWNDRECYALPVSWPKLQPFQHYWLKMFYSYTSGLTCSYSANNVSWAATSDSLIHESTGIIHRERNYRGWYHGIRRLCATAKDCMCAMAERMKFGIEIFTSKLHWLESINCSLDLL